MLTNSAEVCAGALGIWAAGAAIVSLPTMARGMYPPNYLKQLQNICRQIQPQLIVTETELAKALSQIELCAPVATFENLAVSDTFDPTPLDSESEVFIQYSSGSTSDPRGCVLTGDAIAHQLASLERAAEVDPTTDHLVSWLPLSHDMGFFGCLLMSYWTGLPLTLGTPARFLRHPTSWLKDCARVQATMTVAPNFAFDLVIRLARHEMPPPFSIRKCVIGGERVEARTVIGLNKVFGDARFPRTCFLPAYGLAEAVLAVTMTRLADAPRILSADARALQAGEIVRTSPGEPGSVQLVSNGLPLPGSHIRIHDRTEVGEICVQSPSLATGYFGNAELNRRVFDGGELHTGDLGFLDEGELFVTGRLDDMICVGGRNVFARDLEAELFDTSIIRDGCCAVIDVVREGQTIFVLLAELKDVDPPLERIAYRLGRIALQVAAVRIRECHFLPWGSLPKTPSGKIQRFRCRELALDPPQGTCTIIL